MRHKCAFCPDYDLCEKCYENREQIHYQGHQFIPIDHPIPSFYCTADAFVVRGGASKCPFFNKKEQEQQPTTVNKKEEEKTEEKEPVVEVEVTTEQPQAQQQEDQEFVIVEQPDVEVQEVEEAAEEQKPVDVVVEEKQEEAEAEEEEHFEEAIEENDDGPVQVEQIAEPTAIVVQPSAPPQVVEVQQPQPQPQPQHQSQPQKEAIEPAHATTLNILKQMGFDNEQLALFLIRKHKNNVQLVVNEYLNHQQ